MVPGDSGVGPRLCTSGSPGDHLDASLILGGQFSQNLELDLVKTQAWNRLVLTRQYRVPSGLVFSCDHNWTP